MKILPVKDQIKFLYKEREFIAMGVIADRNNCLGKISWKNIMENTPEGYTWEDFIREAEKNGIMTADIFIYKDDLVIPMEAGLCNYKPCLPRPHIKNMKPAKDMIYNSDASGDESYYPLQNDDIYYTYKHFSEGNFKVIAPTLEICRIYKNLWLNNMIKGE